MAASSSRTPAASRAADAQQAQADGNDTSTSADPNLQTLTNESPTEPSLTEGGKIAQNEADLPADRPGFHCGYCGRPVGPEGQHWNEKGEAVPGQHAGTLVVADNWPEVQVDTTVDASAEDTTETEK